VRSAGATVWETFSGGDEEDMRLAC